MNLNTLNTFIEVVKQGSLSKAAEAMQKSNSLVSRHVDELEEYLSVQLFIRSTRQLDLTEAGLAFYEQIHSLPEMIQDAEKNLHDKQESVEGELNIMLPTIDLLCLSPYLARFYDQYPQLQLRFRGYSFYELKEPNLPSIGPTFDICFLLHYSDIFAKCSNLRLCHQFSHKLYLCAHRTYLNQVALPNHINELNQYRLVAHKGQLDSQDKNIYVDGILCNFDFSQANMVMGTLMGTFSAVMDGHGIGLLPKSTIENHSDQLQIILPNCYAITRTGYLLRQDIQTAPKKVQVFIDFIKQIFSIE